MPERLVEADWKFLLPITIVSPFSDLQNLIVLISLGEKNLNGFQITLNQEHRLMLSFSPDYDHLPLISKVEIFEYALQNTEGNDLAKVCHCPVIYQQLISLIFPLIWLFNLEELNILLDRYFGWKVAHQKSGCTGELTIQEVWQWWAWYALLSGPLAIQAY